MADFTNIDGVYAKDTELRSGIDTLRTTVLSNTIKPLTVTKNGTYTAIPSSGTYGYSPVVVDVQEEPWEPLEDGYSNFWFELTNDTLSPWLNFSAKNNDAVIDWGDGSGEQSLDTLTPTHTYSEAGKYVVKVKGVTGIAAQFSSATFEPKYAVILTNVELSSEVVSLGANAFWRCFGIKNIGGNTVITTYATNATTYCSSLQTFAPAINATTVYQAFYQAFCLRKIIIGANVQNIATNSFINCYSLSEIHVQAITPPTLGVSVFSQMPSNYIIYVPVGTGDTYKAAEGWSDYADHILEEGQTPNRAMLSKFENTKKSNNDIEIEEMR